MKKTEAAYKNLLQPSDDLVADIAKIKGILLSWVSAVKWGRVLQGLQSRPLKKAA